jgi:hypothetical protein
MGLDLTNVTTHRSLRDALQQYVGRRAALAAIGAKANGNAAQAPSRPAP